MTEVIPVLRENSEWGGRGRVHKKDDEQGGKVERALREACAPMVTTPPRKAPRVWIAYLLDLRPPEFGSRGLKMSSS